MATCDGGGPAQDARGVQVQHPGLARAGEGYTSCPQEMSSSRSCQSPKSSKRGLVISTEEVEVQAPWERRTDWPATPSSSEATRTPKVVHQRSRPLLDLTSASAGLDNDVGHSRWRWLVIFPGVAGSWWLELWDLFISMIVLMVAFCVPYALTLYGGEDVPEYMVMLDVLFNASFSMDIVLQFFISFPLSEESLHKDLWETDLLVIARRYCGVPCSDGGRGGWFWVDLLSVAPAWLGRLVGRRSFACHPLLLLRTLRLAGSDRTLRLEQVAERCHMRTGFPMILLEMAKFGTITTLACHWAACSWAVLEGKITHKSISYSTHHESWLSSLIMAKGDCCEPDAAHDLSCMYAQAYYWAVMTFSGVGYGDITPQNRMEYLSCTVFMIAVGYVCAFVNGNIFTLFSKLDPISAHWQHDLDELGNLMARRALKAPLQCRVRSFMYETRNLSRQAFQRQLCEELLSEGLQREVAACTSEVQEMMKGIFWMRDLSEEAILDIVRALVPRGYAPMEIVNTRGVLIIMQRGIAGVKGRVISRGDVWGHIDVLLETPQLRDTAMPNTITFVELLMLTKASLIDICNSYPSMDQRLRRAQIRVATARAFCQVAREKHKLRQGISGRSGSSGSMVNAAAPPAGGGGGGGGRSLIRKAPVAAASGSFAYVGGRPLIDDREKIVLGDLVSLLQRVSKRQDALEYQFSQLATQVRESRHNISVSNQAKWNSEQSSASRSFFKSISSFKSEGRSSKG